MAEVWTVTVGGQSYGPYPLDRMEAFIAEGRIVAQSLVQRGGEKESCPAGTDPILATYFVQAEEPQLAAFAEQAIEEPVAEIEEDEPAPTFGKVTDAEHEYPSHIIIFSDVRSRSLNVIEEGIYALGPAFPLLPQVWLLTTHHSVSVIRNTLIDKLGKLDTLFVVDTTLDKAAWFNFGPEQEARIRRVWGNRDAHKRAV